MTTATTKPDNRPAYITQYDRQLEQLLANTKNHKMRVLHDEGVYRHIRFAEPGTTMWHFDLITWPGHLTITGDIGDGFSFKREHDMFGFFNGREINPQYWGEKMPHTITYRKYSDEKFKQRVLESLEGHLESLAESDRTTFMTALTEEVLGDAADFENTAREALDNFEHNGFTFTDTWEWSFNDYDWHYILACHAILWGIRKYLKERPAPALTSTEYATVKRFGLHLEHHTSGPIPIPVLACHADCARTAIQTGCLPTTKLTDYRIFTTPGSTRGQTIPTTPITVIADNHHLHPGLERNTLIAQATNNTQALAVAFRDGTSS